MNILKSFSSLHLFKQAKESVLGIDITSSSIKVVQIKNVKGKAVLETYGELSLGPYVGVEAGSATNLPPQKIAEALNDLLREAKTTTKNCAFSVPLSSSLVTIIEMPDVGRAELEKMIPLEVRKYIPVNISEVALDWWIIPTEEELYGSAEESEPSTGGKKVEVLVVAVHNEILEKYREIATLAEIAPSFYEVEIFSTIRSILDTEPAPAMVLDFGAAITKLYVVEHRIVRSSHVINRGSQAITQALSRSLGVSTAEAEELKRAYDPATANPNTTETISLVISDIFTEANRVLVSYQKRYNKNVAKVFLTGGGSVLGGIQPMASKAFDSEVVLGDPFMKTETPAFLADILRRAGPEFAVALGIALRKLEEGRG
jgi:type IV pilus assembly protein PilM